MAESGSGVCVRVGSHSIIQWKDTAACVLLSQTWPILNDSREAHSGDVDERMLKRLDADVEREWNAAKSQPNSLFAFLRHFGFKLVCF